MRPSICFDFYCAKVFNHKATKSATPIHKEEKAIALDNALLQESYNDADLNRHFHLEKNRNHLPKVDLCPTVILKLCPLCRCGLKNNEPTTSIYISPGLTPIKFHFKAL